ncbi:MAG: hypothetical protein JXR70_16280 [Spirochaetales bacterium]|nr:hypothetical protein [Spirochaetales bacterium]
MERLVKGYGKLLLFGEHSAVYAYPAIGVPLPYGITLKGRVHRNSQNRRINGENAFLDNLTQSISSITKNLNEPGYTIDVKSDLPVSRGFGSSAALCTALTKFFFPGLELSQCWDMAHKLEARFHGRPSGIDTGLSLAHDLSWFHFSPNKELPELYSSNRKLGIWIVPGSVPRQVSTKEIVLNIQQKIKEKHKKTIGLIETLGRITDQTIQMTKGIIDFSAWSKLTIQAHDSLKELELYNDELTEVFKIARTLGNPPGKLSGAGKGGAFYFVFPEKDKAMDFYRQLIAICEKKYHWTLFSPLAI